MDQEAKDKLKQWKRDYHDSQREAREQKMENLSDREWKEMMGQYNQTLSRHNGALGRRR